MTVLPNPTHMPYDRYSSSLSSTLSDYGPVPRPDLVGENNWRVWARALVGLPGLAGFLLPDPNRYDNWRDWGRAFSLAFQG